MDESKRIIRARFLAERNALSGEDRSEKSAEICRRILACEEFRRARVVMLYRSVRSEVSLEGLTDAEPGGEKIFLWPRCGRNGVMDAVLPEGEWTRGAFGIPEPAAGVIVDPRDIDLVICPCAAFDETGVRLGMGGGYYDRFLPRCVRAFSAAAAFEAQKADALPTDEWDVRMDRIFTELTAYPRENRANLVFD